MKNKSYTVRLKPLVIALHAALVVGLALPKLAWAAETTRASVNSVGEQGNLSSENSGSFRPGISADGRFVAFFSGASNLVAGDSNGTGDMFIRDRLTGKTVRASVNSAGIQSNDYSDFPAISGDGRYVAFESRAPNLAPGDYSANFDVLVYDRLTKQTSSVSTSSTDIPSDGHSRFPDISADGRFVAFVSDASNLVASDTNAADDTFVHDRLTKQTTRVSVNSAGVQGNRSSSGYPAISADGRYVAFRSFATNLVAGDTNEAWDIFVHDRVTRQTTRVSKGPASTQYWSGLFIDVSADGRYVAFVSDADSHVAGDTNGVDDVFVNDRRTGKTVRVSVDSDGSQANGASTNVSISADGQFVTFESFASNLVGGDINDRVDVFVRDRTANKTTQVTRNSLGERANHGGNSATISADGRHVAFLSGASNLVSGDTNDSADVFVRDRLLNPSLTSDLTLTQTVSPNPKVGAKFTYTAKVKNNGGSNAANVVLTEIATHSVPARLVALTPSQGACYGGPISVCRLGTLNPGQQATVLMTFVAKTAGTFVNRVSANAAPKDPTPYNSVTKTVKIGP